MELVKIKELDFFDLQSTDKEYKGVFKFSQVAPPTLMIIVAQVDERKLVFRVSCKMHPQVWEGKILLPKSHSVVE